MIVDTRSRYGDWKLDTVIGKNHKQTLNTIVERKSRLMLAVDNDREFAGHVHVAKQRNTQFYFAHPFSSWERGLNENTNGLIRQYFPKKHDFTTIAQKQIENVMNKLNNPPRKCLGFKTPNEEFFGLKQPTVALAT